MDKQQVKLQLMKSVEALKNNDDNAYYANMINALIASNLLGMIKPQTLWEPQKVHTVIDLLLKTESVGGDIVELGVFRGGGTILIAELLHRLSSTRKVIGIDSFEGLPEETPMDAKSNGDVRYAKGKFKNESSYEYTSLVSKLFDPGNHIHFIKGFFEDIFPKLHLENKLSLVIVDPDQYKGTMESLNKFYDHVNPGGYFLIDDYHSTSAVGVKKAVDEFLQDKPETIRDGGLTMAYFKKQ